MPTSLVAHEQPVSKIFSNDYVFRIPGYQRPYAWTTEQAGDLFDDLTGFMKANEGPIDEMPPYFLGNIVLIKHENMPDADIVDGQQRLTTLTLLLSAIRNNISSHDAQDITLLLYERGRLIPLSQGDQYVVSWLPASVDRDGGDGSRQWRERAV